MEWFRSWFESPYYPMLYRHRDDREASAFLERLSSILDLPKGARVLDLACGQGRHSIWLNRHGFDVTGIDISAYNIETAQAQANDSLRFIRHDMREPLQLEPFDLVLNAFTSFGYFDDVQDNHRVLEAVYSELKPGGWFVLDYFHTNHVLEHLVPHEEREATAVSFVIERELMKDGFVEKRIHIRDHDRHISQQFQERVYAFSPEDLIGMLETCGFQVQDHFGDYSLSHTSSEPATRVILLARKPDDNPL